MDMSDIALGMMGPSYMPGLVEENSLDTQVVPVPGSELIMAPSQWSRGHYPPKLHLDVDRTAIISTDI
ncbi:hypothetical protein HID58_093231 [Brassica napus]|uniref:Uncharacterized protein n=1 Tax=Brassica napus TaxID=3708 RepID=A0ABQ7XC47_BRANA|nr:hypothetical protein HID58_093231 [Brassica napus]